MIKIKYPGLSLAIGTVFIIIWLVRDIPLLLTLPFLFVFGMLAGRLAARIDRPFK